MEDIGGEIKFMYNLKDFNKTIDDFGLNETLFNKAGCYVEC